MYYIRSFTWGPVEKEQSSLSRHCLPVDYNTANQHRLTWKMWYSRPYGRDRHCSKMVNTQSGTQTLSPSLPNILKPLKTYCTGGFYISLHTQMHSPQVISQYNIVEVLVLPI